MNTLPRQDSTRRYPWLSDGHISLDGSKWLQENISGHGGSFDAKKVLNLPQQTLHNSATEIANLKEAIAKLEAEKEAGLAEFYKILKKVSCLESQVIIAEERARKAEDEIFKLKEEKEVSELAEKALLEKLESMEKLLEEKNGLEASNSYLNDALVSLEESYETIAAEKLALEFETTVLFGEMRMKAADAEEERKALLENFNSVSRKLGILEIETKNLRKINDVLTQKGEERNAYEEKLKNDVEDINSKLAELQKSYQNLQTGNEKVLQENMCLRKDCLELNQKNCDLVDELTTVKTANGLLVYEVGIRKDLVHERESQLHEAEQNVVTTLNEKARLENFIEILKKSGEELISENSDASKHLSIGQTCKLVDSMKADDLMPEEIVSGKEKKLDARRAKFGSKFLLKGFLHRRVGSEILLSRNQSKKNSFFSCIQSKKWEISPRKNYNQI